MNGLGGYLKNRCAPCQPLYCSSLKRDRLQTLIRSLTFGALIKTCCVHHGSEVIHAPIRAIWLADARDRMYTGCKQQLLLIYARHLCMCMWDCRANFCCFSRVLHPKFHNFRKNIVQVGAGHVFINFLDEIWERNLILRWQKARALNCQTRSDCLQIWQSPDSTPCCGCFCLQISPWIPYFFVKPPT